MFARSSKRITWIIITLCSLVRRRTVVPVSPYLFQYFIPPLHHFTISPLHHLIHFAYYHIRNYSGKMFKLIQKYQGSEEALLCELPKVKLIKGGEMFQVPSCSVSHLPSFKIWQEHPNEVERKGLEQKKKNLMLSIFGHFDLMVWWKAKEIPGFTTYPFEEETDHSKIKVLSGKLDQLKIKFEKNMPGKTRKIKKWLQLTKNTRKRKEIVFILNSLKLIRNNKSNRIM